MKQDANTLPKGRQLPQSSVKWAFIVLLGINTFNYIDRYILPAILPKVQAEFGLNPTQAGLLGSAFLFVYALSTVPLGILADRKIRKHIVGICVAIWSAATLISGLTHNFAQLFVARSVLGIGEGGYAPASLSLLGDYFPQAKRGRVLALWSAGTLIGAAIGFTLGGLIADTLGWRAAFYVAGIPGVVFAILAYKMFEPPRGFYDQVSSQQPSTKIPANIQSTVPIKQVLLILLKKPTYWLVLGAIICSLFAVGGVTYWLPTYCVHVFGLSVRQAGTLSGIVLVTSGLIGTFAGGWLADAAEKRWAEGRMAVVAFGFLAGTPLVLFALLSHKFIIFLTLLIFAAIFLNFCTGPLNAITQDIIAPRMRATAVGITLLVGHMLGDAFSPFFIGVLDTKLHSLQQALLISIPTTFLLAGILCILGFRSVARDMQRMHIEEIA